MQLMLSNHLADKHDYESSSRIQTMICHYTLLTFASSKTYSYTLTFMQVESHQYKFKFVIIINFIQSNSNQNSEKQPLKNKNLHVCLYAPERYMQYYSIVQYKYE